MMSHVAKRFVPLWPALILIIVIVAASLFFAFFYSWPQRVFGVGILLMKGEIAQVLSPKSGTVEKWLVEEGDELRANEHVLTIRSYENPLEQISVKAPAPGYLAEITAYPGTVVKPGDSLALITALGDKRRDLELIGFVSSLDGKKLKPGMKAQIWPSITNRHTDGALLAIVKKVGKLPTSKAALKSLVKIPELAKFLRTKLQGEAFLVVLNLIPNQNSPSGYEWSGTGPSFALDYGIIADFSIIYGRQSFAEFMIPWGW